MDVAEAVFPWVAMVIAVAVVVTPLLQMANPVRRRELQLSLNMTPKTNVIVGALWAAGAVVMILLGIGLAAVGRVYLWGLIPLGAAQLFVVGFHVYIALLPFPDLEGAAEAEAEAAEPVD